MHRQSRQRQDRHDRWSLRAVNTLTIVMLALAGWAMASMIWPTEAECETNCPVGLCHTSAMCGSACRCDTEPGTGIGKCVPQ